jgi:hypothetical protein
LRQLGNTVLDALGYQRQRELKENVVWDVARHQMRALGIRFLHIDELQHLFQVRDPGEVQRVRNMLKSLLAPRGWPPTFLFLSGMPEIVPVLQEDIQVKRRCPPVQFAALTGKDAMLIRRTVDFFAGKASLDASELSVDDFIARLMHGGLGQLGICIEIIQDAIREAFDEVSPMLRLEDFATVYAERSGCRPDANVFTASDWWSIDVRSSFGFGEMTAEEKPHGTPRDRRNS